MQNDAQSLTGKKLQRKQSPKQDSSKSSAGIELLRTRVATAETLLKRAREQARLAKRRRKLAKLLAKRTRKVAKLAKANLAEARAALDRAEARLMKTPNQSAVRQKTRKAKATRTISVLKSKKSAAPRKRRKPSRTTQQAPSASPAKTAGLGEIAISLGTGTEQPVDPKAESQSNADESLLAENQFKN